ncbi:MAG: ROK family transcriptional regulator [Treponema sp.]|nr:ROK family transcriptional regulator [Treponema sp.]
MVYAGINSINVKNINRSRLLKLLNNAGAMSRKDMASALDLTPAAVTQITSELIANGILEERGEIEEAGRSGRKKILVDINYRAARVLTICIEVHEVTISVCELDGTLVEQKKIPTDRNTDPETFILSIADIANELMDSVADDGIPFIGAGVSVPGAVSRSDGISCRAQSIWRESVAVKACLEKKLSIPIIVENNVKAFAEAELVYGTGKVEDNIFFVKWGAGVGSSIVINHTIYDNQKGITSELGHMVVSPGGEKCWCGRSGCLETMVSVHAMTKKVLSLFSKEHTPLLYEKVHGDKNKITEDSFESWIMTEDAAIVHILDDAIKLLAQTVSNAVTLLAPDRVVIFGDMFNFTSVYKKFIDTYTALAPYDDKSLFMYSALSNKIDYIGALAVVFNDYLLIQ